MVWTYERNRQRVVFEVHPGSEATGYEVVCRFPGGRVKTDMFATLAGLQAYLAALEDELDAEGWGLVDAPRRRQPIARYRPHVPSSN